MKTDLFEDCLNEIQTLKARKERGEFNKEDETRATKMIDMFAAEYHGENTSRWDVLKNQAWKLLGL